MRSIDWHTLFTHKNTIICFLLGCRAARARPPSVLRRTSAGADMSDAKAGAQLDDKNADSQVKEAAKRLN